MSEKKSFRIDVLLARESPTEGKQWSSGWSPSNSPRSNHSHQDGGSLSPPISPGSEPTSVQSNSPVHSHGSGGAHNNNNNHDNQSLTGHGHHHHHLAHHHGYASSRGALNGSFGLIMEGCGGMASQASKCVPLTFTLNVCQISGGGNSARGTPNGSSPVGVPSSAASLHGPTSLFGSLHSYMSSSGLNHFGSGSAFHLPSLAAVESAAAAEAGKGGGMVAVSSAGPSTSTVGPGGGVSGFVGLSVANAHQLQLEWLARNGMLYPRLPDLAGKRKRKPFRFAFIHLFPGSSSFQK